MKNVMFEGVSSSLFAGAESWFGPQVGGIDFVGGEFEGVDLVYNPRATICSFSLRLRRRERERAWLVCNSDTEFVRKCSLPQHRASIVAGSALYLSEASQLVLLPQVVLVGLVSVLFEPGIHTRITVNDASKPVYCHVQLVLKME